MFTDFCTSCGSFDDTTFTSSEKDTIQSFSNLVTSIYNKAKQHNDTYKSLALIASAPILRKSNYV